MSNRADFEKHLLNIVPVNLVKNSDDEYVNPFIQCRWEDWRSRQPEIDALKARGESNAQLVNSLLKAIEFLMKAAAEAELSLKKAKALEK